MTRSRFQVWLMAAMLALVTVALYWPVTGYDFVNYDDPAYFSENEHVLAGLTWRNLAWAFQTTLDASWYPVSWLSFMLDAAVFGRGPAGPHLMNVLLHAANGVLLFLLWKRLTGSLWRSALVAGLFVLHPLHVESVAWVSERKDVLSTLFGLLALLAYARYVEVQSSKPKVQSQEAERIKQKAESRKQKSETTMPESEAGGPWSVVRGPWSLPHLPSSIFYLLSLFLFALGLMSKPMLVTWPFVLLLLDYWPLRRLGRAFHTQVAADVSRRHLAGDKNAPTDVGGYTLPANRAGYATSGSALSTKTLLSTLNSQLSTILPLLLEKLPFLFLAIIVSVVNVVVHKQVGALAPLDSVSMPARVANAFVSYARYLGKLFWPTDLAIPYLYPGHWPLGSVCLGAALVAGFSGASFWLGRRRPYLLVGWFWFLGTLVPVIGLIQWGNQAMADRFLYVPAIGLFVALAWGLGDLTEQWQLPKPAVGSVAALALLALALRSHDQLRYWRNSEALFRHTLEVSEDNYLARNNLGAALVKKGQTEEAIRQFQEAIRVSPAEANAHYNLGNALVGKGQTEAAISQFQEAVRLKPDSAAIHYNLGNALARKGQMDEAINQFQVALRLQPAYPEAFGALAGALGGQGKYAEAIRFYQAALKAKPDQEGVLNNLAWLLASCPDPAFRNGPEAVRLATRACALTSYGQPLLIGTLAAAQAEAGDFSGAIATAERAAALASTLHLEQVAAKNRELLQLYRQGQAFHEERKQTTDGHR